MEIKFETNGEVTIPKIVLTVILTIALFLGGIFMAGSSSKLKKQCTYKTTAIVSDIKENSGSDGSTYAPEYTYTYNGEEYKAVSRIYSSSIKVSQGDEVEFYLDPDDPSTYYCPSEKGSKVFTIVFFGFGAVCLLFTVLNIKKYREQY